MPDWVARVLRTLLQLLAAGAFTAFFSEVVKIIPPEYQPLAMAFFMLLVTFAQNWAEAATGKALLKPVGAQSERV